MKSLDHGHHILLLISQIDMNEDLYDVNKEITILDILDRVLTKGVVITGDIVISVADIDLIYLGLKVLLSSVETMEKLRIVK